MKALLLLSLLSLLPTALAADSCESPEGQLAQCHLRIDTGPGPKGVAFSPDDQHIWVSLLGGPPSVEVYSVATGEKIHTLTLGSNGAVEVAFSTDQKTAFISQMETALVYEIDVATMATTAQHSTRSTWTKVVEPSRDGRWLYVSNWVGNDVSRIDRTGQEKTRRIRTAKTPRGLYLTHEADHLYIASFGTGKLQILNTETLVIEDIYQGGVLRHLVANERTGKLFASDMRRGQILIHDMQLNTTTALARTDANPNTIALTPDGEMLAVSCRGRNNRESYYRPGPEWGSILLFDTDTGRKLDAIIGGNQPTGLAISKDGQWLASTDLLDNRVSLYRLPTSATLKAANGGRSSTYKAEMKK
jgi:DNA-binding beta-propeller fold protein YncE